MHSVTRKRRRTRTSVAAAVAVAAAIGLIVAGSLVAAGGSLRSVSAGRAVTRAAAASALPLRFERNVGQTDRRVEFLSRGAGYTFLMTRKGAVLKLSSRAKRSRRVAREAVVGLNFAGANRHPGVEGLGLLPGVSNYLRGRDRSEWVTGVPNYSKVVYSGVYDGVDLTYHASRAGELEFDLTLAPGADPDQIRLAYSGATLTVDRSGALVLRAGGGELRQNPPVIYQRIDGVRRAVRGRYVLHGAHQVGFALEGYDRNAPVVIDPVIAYSTYLGGSGDDNAIWSDIDGAGNFYVTGATSSPDYPTTGRAFQKGFQGGDSDAFVTKVNPSGSGLVYSTYLGGESSDFAIGLDVDRSGRVVVTGGTASAGFPTTRGALQRQFAGGDLDTFVSKLDSTGSRLVFSTFLGAEATDLGFISFFDASGNVYVEGETGSTAFPTTRRAFQRSYGGGDADGFVTKLTPDGSTLVYSTYIGGSGYDGAHDGTLDDSGSFYIDGPTDSTDFPTSRGAFQRSFAGGPLDAWVAKLNPRGTALDYSTYLGGSGEEDVQDLTIDRFGNAYVPGPTSSTDFPVTRNAFQQSYRGGDFDGYVAKVNPRGSGLKYATYLGGSEFDLAGAVRVDRDGNAYVPGITGSTDFPVTRDALQATYRGGPTDAFVLKLNEHGSRLGFSTFLGGSGEDGSAGAGAWLDRAGNFYVPGFTDSTDFPVTRRAFQKTNAGTLDIFLVKMAFREQDDSGHHGDERQWGQGQAGDRRLGPRGRPRRPNARRPRN